MVPRLVPAGRAVACEPAPGRDAAVPGDLWIALGWTVLSLLFGFSLGLWAAAGATLVGVSLAWARSAAWQAGAVPVPLVAQLAPMARLLRGPRALAPWHNATSVTLYAPGMLARAFAPRPGAAVAG